MSGFTVAALDESTWPGFAELVERNNGIYGGCWCMAFHGKAAYREPDARSSKLALVRTGDAHAALVLDGDGDVQGWAQFGRPDELAGFKHRRAYEKDPPPIPDWRIGCVFVDRAHRGTGVARAAVAGAMQLISAAGGGLVEVISEATEGRTTPGRFLFTGSAELFQQHGFQKVRQVGKHAWILSRTLS